MTSTPICHNWSHHAGGFIHLARSSDTPNLDLSTTSLHERHAAALITTLRHISNTTSSSSRKGRGRAQKPQDVAHERAPSHECKPLQMQPGARRSTRQQTDQPIMYRTHAHHAPARYTLRGPQTKTNMIHSDHSVLRAADAVRTHTITGRRPPRKKRGVSSGPVCSYSHRPCFLLGSSRRKQPQLRSGSSSSSESRLRISAESSRPKLPYDCSL